MPLPEMNMMIHSFYCTEGKEVRRPQERAKLMVKFNRIMGLFGKR